jgi:hypothetical protein
MACHLAKTFSDRNMHDAFARNIEKNFFVSKFLKYFFERSVLFLEADFFVLPCLFSN